jgi:hypothetical protein
LQAAARTIPIVFIQANDPLSKVLSPRWPTRAATPPGSELDPKRLQLLHEIIPSVTRATFLINPNLTPAARFARPDYVNAWLDKLVNWDFAAHQLAA